MSERCVPTGPCILLDGQLAVVQVSPAVQRWLGGPEPVLVVRQQRLHAPAAPLALDRCLARAARGNRTALALARTGRLALTLRAEPVAEPQRLPGHAGVLVTLRDPELEVPDAALLQDLFGLTPTEALVAVGLAQGLDSAELALTLGVQANTVLSHIKRVLLKSGTRRQPELVSLVLRSAAMPHPWLAGPGVAQMGNDAIARDEHSRPRPEPATCPCN